jgi:hypothetical protein
MNPTASTHQPLPRRWRPLALAAGLLAAASFGAQAQAQSIVMAGSYQNFDVLNNTGQPVHGFEMEVHGMSSADITRIFAGVGIIRYVSATTTDFAGGVYVRWIAPYDAATGQFTTATPVPASMTTVPGESCWIPAMGANYAAAGCEHFGISGNRNPTSIVYRWLAADPAVPGTVKAIGGALSLAAPVWTVVPPASQR